MKVDRQKEFDLWWASVEKHSKECRLAIPGLMFKEMMFSFFLRFIKPTEPEGLPIDINISLGLLLEACTQLENYCWPNGDWRGEVNMRGCIKPIAAVVNRAKVLQHNLLEKYPI